MWWIALVLLAVLAAAAWWFWWMVKDYPSGREQDAGKAPPKDCVPLLAEQKSKGAPVEFVVHKNATHNWETAALGGGTFRKKGRDGKDIIYRYNPQVTAESIKLAFEFLDRYVKGGR